MSNFSLSNNLLNIIYLKLQIIKESFVQLIFILGNTETMAM